MRSSGVTGSASPEVTGGSPYKFYSGPDAYKQYMTRHSNRAGIPKMNTPNSAGTTAPVAEPVVQSTTPGSVKYSQVDDVNNIAKALKKTNVGGAIGLEDVTLTESLGFYSRAASPEARLVFDLIIDDVILDFPPERITPVENIRAKIRAVPAKGQIQFSTRMAIYSPGNSASALARLAAKASLTAVQAAAKIGMRGVVFGARMLIAVNPLLQVAGVVLMIYDIVEGIIWLNANWGKSKEVQPFSLDASALLPDGKPIDPTTFRELCRVYVPTRSTSFWVICGRMNVVVRIPSQLTTLFPCYPIVLLLLAWEFSLLTTRDVSVMVWDHKSVQMDIL
jgi:hypothetical protein